MCQFPAAPADKDNSARGASPWDVPMSSSGSLLPPTTQKSAIDTTGECLLHLNACAGGHHVQEDGLFRSLASISDLRSGGAWGGAAGGREVSYSPCTRSPMWASCAPASGARTKSGTVGLAPPARPSRQLAGPYVRPASHPVLPPVKTRPTPRVRHVLAFALHEGAPGYHPKSGLMAGSLPRLFCTLWLRGARGRCESRGWTRRRESDWCSSASPA